ncbi:hypothetical protein CC1G_05547 [Coprinopsis cinerea okayama7|uniref:Uncharacterized protein n=1 Tax=Coprinopsis cinerea (strain Okayama-7 / 130 / ATCC MYA-4618 / FGSC 9003) TaxID=240176 RepID=A8P1C3_COPC7|nr:hypothetical protein CC1G_05547 [Coprinopsis cinerea okayama7\|eukprot:XP_001838066.1 hypothetical protein CC1G_05547 [Coprinopsis cinerea okayama7\
MPHLHTLIIEERAWDRYEHEPIVNTRPYLHDFFSRLVFTRLSFLELSTFCNVKYGSSSIVSCRSSPSTSTPWTRSRPSASYYAGFLASLSRQSHFREMAAGVSKLELTFMLPSRLADENTVTARDPETSAYLQEFFDVFRGADDITASPAALPFLLDYRQMMKTSVPGVYRPSFRRLQSLAAAGVTLQSFPKVRDRLTELVSLRQTVFPNCPRPVVLFRGLNRIRDSQ